MPDHWAGRYWAELWVLDDFCDMGWYCAIGARLHSNHDILRFIQDHVEAADPERVEIRIKRIDPVRAEEQLKMRVEAGRADRG